MKLTTVVSEAAITHCDFVSETESNEIETVFHCGFLAWHEILFQQSIIEFLWE